MWRKATPDKVFRRLKRLWCARFALRESSATDIDIDKVASIKAALRDGSYSIDSSNIADGMLGVARDLLRKAPRE